MFPVRTILWCPTKEARHEGSLLPAGNSDLYLLKSQFFYGQKAKDTTVKKRASQARYVDR